MSSAIKVFKFGGASVKDAAAIRNVHRIIAQYTDTPLVVIVSAFGKSTNHFEELLVTDNPGSQIAALLDFHMGIAHELCPDDMALQARINDLFVELDWALQDKEINTYDFTYDQIVSIGELLSTTIIAAYLLQEGMAVEWMDARSVIKTDDTYRAANVNWEETKKRIQKDVLPALSSSKVVMTQGFIGSTDYNETTTLGREGSDYTASIFAYCLDADMSCSWKNVPGIMTADPEFFPDAVKIDRVSYAEAVELTYYGARVLHPKTIRPIQVKGIPLYIRSFETPDIMGTVVHKEGSEHYPPVVVLLYEQILLTLSSKDYTFIAENHFEQLFSILDKHHIKVNLTQNSALKVFVCVGDAGERLTRAIEELEGIFDLKITRDLELFSVRHYNDQALESLLKGKSVILQEKTMKTARFVVNTATS